jgi:hypothetical protein
MRATPTACAHTRECEARSHSRSRLAPRVPYHTSAVDSRWLFTNGKDLQALVVGCPAAAKRAAPRAI